MSIIIILRNPNWFLFILLISELLLHALFDSLSLLFFLALFRAALTGGLTLRMTLKATKTTLQMTSTAINTLMLTTMLMVMKTAMTATALVVAATTRGAATRSGWQSLSRPLRRRQTTVPSQPPLRRPHTRPAWTAAHRSTWLCRCLAMRRTFCTAINNNSCLTTSSRRTHSRRSSSSTNPCLWIRSIRLCIREGSLTTLTIFQRNSSNSLCNSRTTSSSSQSCMALTVCSKRHTHAESLKGSLCGQKTLKGPIVGKPFYIDAILCDTVTERES